MRMSSHQLPAFNAENEAPFVYEAAAETASRCRIVLYQQMLFDPRKPVCKILVVILTFWGLEFWRDCLALKKVGSINDKRSGCDLFLVLLLVLAMIIHITWAPPHFTRSPCPKRKFTGPPWPDYPIIRPPCILYTNIITNASHAFMNAHTHVRTHMHKLNQVSACTCVRVWVLAHVTLFEFSIRSICMCEEFGKYVSNRIFMSVPDLVRFGPLFLTRLEVQCSFNFVLDRWSIDMVVQWHGGLLACWSMWCVGPLTWSIDTVG